MYDVGTGSGPTASSVVLITKALLKKAVRCAQRRRAHHQWSRRDGPAHATHCHTEDACRRR